MAKLVNMDEIGQFAPKMDKIGHNEPKSNKISNNGQNWIIWTKTGQNRQNEPK